MKELEFARKIDVDAIRINDYVQGKKNKMIYKVVAVDTHSVVLEEVSDCTKQKKIMKATLARNYEKYSLLETLVPEAVAPEEEVAVEPVEVEEQPEEVAVEPVEATPVTTTTPNDKTIEVKVPSEPKSNGKKKKLSDSEYIQLATELLQKIYKTKKEAALKYGVDASICSDCLSEKYCRTSCKSKISELKIKFGYSK